MALGIAINVTSLLRSSIIKRNVISVVTGMVVEKIARSVKYIVRNVEDQLRYKKIHGSLPLSNYAHYHSLRMTVDIQLCCVPPKFAFGGLYMSAKR